MSPEYLELPDDTLVFAWFLGDHQIGIWYSVPPAEDDLYPESWSLAFDDTTLVDVLGECPRVVAATMRSDDALVLDLDAQCRPGVDYVLTAFGRDVTVTALYPTTDSSTTMAVALLDIDAPAVPANGFTLAPSGDYKLSGELATVEKMIWAILLTPEGSFDWDPDFGSNLRLKRLRPADLGAMRRKIQGMVQQIPYVRAASVQLLFDADEMMVSVYADTTFGDLQTQRGLNAPR
jgi:hypothetical protein